MKTLTRNHDNNYITQTVVACIYILEQAANELQAFYSQFTGTTLRESSDVPARHRRPAAPSCTSGVRSFRAVPTRGAEGVKVLAWRRRVRVAAAQNFFVARLPQQYPPQHTPPTRLRRLRWRRPSPRPCECRRHQHYHHL